MALSHQADHINIFLNFIHTLEVSSVKSPDKKLQFFRDLMSGDFMSGDFMSYIAQFGDFFSGDFMSRDFLTGYQVKFMYQSPYLSKSYMLIF